MPDAIGILFVRQLFYAKRPGILSEMEDTPPVHCRRCHRDIPAEEYQNHYRFCPGFASKCEEWNCPNHPAR
ncbi:MAG: hypothetical protein AABO58_25930 [Acidobacteriota bacterium]